MTTRFRWLAGAVAVCMMGLPLVPTAAASVSYDDGMFGRMLYDAVPSNPVVQTWNWFLIDLQPGDRIEARLTWVDQGRPIPLFNLGLGLPNDLDLVLYKPNIPSVTGVPLPRNIDYILADPDFWVQYYQTYATGLALNQACQGMAAQSQGHLPGDFEEAIAYDVPSDGMGTYRLAIKGFWLTDDQDYHLEITVMDQGEDVTADRNPRGPGGTWDIRVESAPYCQFL